VRPLGRVILGCWGVAMQDLGYELPRIPIPRTWVNKGLKKGVGGENRNRCALRREDVPPP
jgi:hypothetical protein